MYLMNYRLELINYKERITRKNIEVQNKMHIEVQKGTSHSTYKEHSTVHNEVHTYTVQKQSSRHRKAQTQTVRT